MGDKRETARARREAASWFARLGRRAVSTDDLRAFRDWRGAADNQQAYAQLEQTWSAAGDLRHDPDIQAATQAALDRRQAGGRLLTSLTPARMAFGAAGLLVVIFAAIAFASGQFSPAYETGVGEQRLVVLEDGSRLRLNTDSQVRVHFTRGEREIRLLRGQAFFDVAPDTRRPFIVEAGETSVRALGTRFDVRRQPTRTEVTLLEGKVQVREPSRSQPWLLVPDQQLTVVPGHRAIRQPTDAGKVSSWTTGRLMFEETPLAAAIAEVNRYGGEQIALDAPALAEAPVSGVFDVGDTEAFVAAVALLFDLEAERTERAVRLHDRTS